MAGRPRGRASVNADLDPSGRYIAASGCFFSGPHDYVEVVDRSTAQGGEQTLVVRVVG